MLSLFTGSITAFVAAIISFFIKISIPTSLVRNWPILKFQKCFSLLQITLTSSIVNEVNLALNFCLITLFTFK